MSIILAFSLLEDHEPWDAKTNFVVIMISLFSKNTWEEPTSG